MTMTFLNAIVALGLAAAPRPGLMPPQHAAATTPAPDRQITVQVQNNNFQDVDVYAITQGMTWRLGTVAGLEETTFTLPRGMAVSDAELRLAFAPIAGWNYWVSPPVLVSPGDRLTSQIGSMLDFSTVTPL